MKIKPVSLILCLLLAGCSSSPNSQERYYVEETIETESAINLTPTATNTSVSPSRTPLPVPQVTILPTTTSKPNVTASPALTVQASLDELVTATSTPTMVTPYPPGVLAQLPPSTKDLFVIVDGSIKVWRQATGNVETLGQENSSNSMNSHEPLNEAITSFQLDADGNSLVAARKTNDNPPTYTVFWLDLETGSHLDLAVDVPYLLEFSFAPDGNQVVYTIGDETSLGSIGNGMVLPYRGTIYLQDVTLSQPAHPIGLCTNIDQEGIERESPSCMGLLWSPDSQILAWADARGIWGYWLTSDNTTLLQPSLINVEDSFEVNVFVPIDWSPSGRFMRLDVWHYEGGNEAILDLQSGQLIEIPYTFSYEGPVVPSLTWLQDDRLFMVRTEGAHRNFVNFAEIWHVVPEHNELALDRSINIHTGSEAYVSNAAQIADGSLAFSVFSYEEGDETAGLYRIDLAEEFPQKLNDLPPQIDYSGSVYWTSDGEGALVVWYEDPQGSKYTGTTYDFVYIKLGDPLFYYVRPFLGQQISNDNGHLQIVWND